MMSNLVSERSPIKMLPGKRPNEYGPREACCLRGFKRPRVSAIREFPRGCGVAASEVRNEGGTLVKTSNERLNIGTSKPFEMSRTKSNTDESMKSPIELSPYKLKSGPVKPPIKSLPNYLKSKTMKRRVELLPNELKSEYIKAPVLHGNTLLKNVEMELPRVPEKVKFINVGNNNAIPKDTDMLCGSDTSPRPCVISKKYPSPKFRKGITIFRDFPRGCGRRNLYISSKCAISPVDKFVNAEQRMFQADGEKIKSEGAKSLSDSKALMCSVKNTSVHMTRSDGHIVPGATQMGVKNSDCLVATGASDGFNFLDVEAGRYNALPDEKHNGVLSVKQSDGLTSNGHHEALSRAKYLEVLEQFEQILQRRLLEIQLEEKSMGKKYISNMYMEIAMVLKNQEKWIYMNQKLLGAIPGIEVGDQFRYRAELVVVGLHVQFSAGIDYMEKDGKKIATSIVSSGRYSSDKEFSDVLIYSGQGGNQIMGEKNSKDQALVRGNLALKNSMDEETPVRVIRGRRSMNRATFTYDGLYIVSKFWQERAKNGKLVYMFRLNRMQGQPKLKLSKLQNFAKSNARKSKARQGLALLSDISSGKEDISIRVINDINNDKPPTFHYIPRMIYPILCGSFVETSGCQCIDGCSDHQQCSCITKNGGMMPFNENGALLKAKPRTIVHECGPSCKCPPSCKNRVSQHGIKLQLEIFKTKAKGWGVRSRNFISSGSFICEYVGELLNDKQAEERIDLDEYLFDIGDKDGFAIDAANTGNIGRFFNHSCSPNLYAQDVLYDHDDKMMPHVMLFATQNIRPLQELTYHYNYKIGQVHDSNGNVKKKACYCGATECNGRMY